MGIKDFFVSHGIDLAECEVCLGGGSFTLMEMEVSPLDFLAQAEEDFERGGISALINATTNAKRAFVCQIDQLLISLGYSSLRWNMPKKVERLRALGLLAPSLLRKTVEMRNILEHEYKAPDLKFVGESLDVASLFVMSASALFIPFDDVLEFFVPDPDDKADEIKSVTVGLNRKAGKVFYTVYLYVDAEQGSQCVAQCEIPSGSVLFEAMVKLSVSLMLKYRVPEAIRNFQISFRDA